MSGVRKTRPIGHSSTGGKRPSGRWWNIASNYQTATLDSGTLPVRARDHAAPQLHEGEHPASGHQGLGQEA